MLTLLSTSELPLSSWASGPKSAVNSGFTNCTCQKDDTRNFSWLCLLVEKHSHLPVAIEIFTVDSRMICLRHLKKSVAAAAAFFSSSSSFSYPYLLCLSFSKHGDLVNEGSLRDSSPQKQASATLGKPCSTMSALPVWRAAAAADKAFGREDQSWPFDEEINLSPTFHLVKLSSGCLLDVISGIWLWSGR